MVAALYLLSTLASWSAIACLITAIAKIGGRRRSVEWFVWSGLLFTLSAFAGRPVLRTFGLPVVWPILPFTLWLTLILCAFSVLLIASKHAFSVAAKPVDLRRAVARTTCRCAPGRRRPA